MNSEPANDCDEPPTPQATIDAMARGILRMLDQQAESIKRSEDMKYKRRRVKLADQAPEETEGV